MRSAAVFACATLAFAASTSSSSAQSSKPEDPAIVRRLQALADSLAAGGTFSGVVVLARDDSVLFERAYGLADRATGRRNQLTTAFNLASVGKLFTATAIQELANAERLDLDAPLARAWADYPNRNVAQRVTSVRLSRHHCPARGHRAALAERLDLSASE